MPNEINWKKFKEWGRAEYLCTGVTVSADWAQEVIRAALKFPDIMVSVKPFRKGISSITILTVSGQDGNALPTEVEDQLFEFATHLPAIEIQH